MTGFNCVAWEKSPNVINTGATQPELPLHIRTSATSTSHTAESMTNLTGSQKGYPSKQ